MAEFEILEHTADVGLRARGSTLEEVFAAATIGMAQIAGSWQPGEAEPVSVEVEASDLEAVLVEWLGAVLYIYEARDAGLAGVRMAEVSPSRAAGEIDLAPFVGDPSEGVQIKAVTFHQVAVERSDGGWSATVFFDI